MYINLMKKGTIRPVTSITQLDSRFAARDEFAEMTA
jgi:hypothetical protein